MEFDVLIVGGGLAGSVVARQMAEKGRQVLILEKRSRVGGNLRDIVDETGIRVHLYGPHIFHTDKEQVLQYLQRFGRWQPYDLRCMAMLDGRFIPTPFGFEAIDLLYPKAQARSLKGKLTARYGAAGSAAVTELLKSEDAQVRGFARLLFEKDFAPYAAKQWSVPLSDISPEVVGRVPVWFSYRKSYYPDRYQLLPQRGYTDFFEKLLAHPKIKIELGCDALQLLRIGPQGKGLTWQGRVLKKPVVYTGPVDALFGFRFGQLPYRSLEFRWERLEKEQFQPAPVVAYPQAEGFTRITEYKQLTGGAGSRTVIAREYPQAAWAQRGAEPYYPVPTKETEAQMADYRAAVAQVENLYLCGRLAEYRYYNMDQVIESALKTAQRIEAGGGPV